MLSKFLRFTNQNPYSLVFGCSHFNPLYVYSKPLDIIKKLFSDKIAINLSIVSNNCIILFKLYVDEHHSNDAR